ncbi:MAG: glycosyltransferase family 39 protein [Kofleriaceae bacterium]
MRRLPAWKTDGAANLAARIAIPCALVALAGWSFAQRWQLLASSPFPLGVDGYFYPLQLRALLAHGTLAYPASPLAFYLLAPFAALSDPITGAKLGAALLGAAIAFPAYGVGARLGAGRGAGLIAAVLATTSVGSAYLTIEFVKNGIGLTVALTALWLALRAIEAPTRARLAAAVAGLVGAYATHKMAAALVGGVGIPAALAALADRGVLRGRRLIYAIAGAIAAVAGVLVVSALAPHRLLSIEDAGLWHGLWSATPAWTAPAQTRASGDLVLGHDAVLGAGLAVAAFVAFGLRARALGRQPTDRHPAHVRPAGAITAASWPILVLAIAIGLPFLAVSDPQGLGFRLRLAAFVPAALAAAILARAVLGRAAHRDAVLAALAAVLAFLRQPTAALEGVVYTHPALVSAAEALTGRVPPGMTLIVPERHIAFLVAWYTRAPVALGPDGIAPALRGRLLPLHFIGAGGALDRALIAARAEPSLVPPLGVHPLHPNGLVLVTEPTWIWALAQLPPADRAYFAAWPTI